MNKDILRESLDSAVSEYKDYARNDLLVSLACSYDTETGEDFTVYFAVPIDYLSLYLAEENKVPVSSARIQEWLDNEYTSEDSEFILERAMLEHKVAFYSIR